MFFILSIFCLCGVVMLPVVFTMLYVCLIRPAFLDYEKEFENPDNNES